MSTTYKVVADKIVHFPYALKNASDIVEFLETVESKAAGDWIPWISGGEVNTYQYGVLKELSPSKNQLELNNKVKIQTETILSNMYEAMDSCFLQYYECLGFPKNDALSWSTKYRQGLDHIAIKKYFENEQLGPHPDSESIDPIEYTASVYFNNDYEGGELGFPDHGVSVKPTTGSVVIFPASFLHESKPIKNGIKYVTNILSSVPRKIVDEFHTSTCFKTV
jgi:hypothetical protein